MRDPEERMPLIRVSRIHLVVGIEEDSVLMDRENTTVERHLGIVQPGGVWRDRVTACSEMVPLELNGHLDPDPLLQGVGFRGDRARAAGECKQAKQRGKVFHEIGQRRVDRKSGRTFEEKQQKISRPPGPAILRLPREPKSGHGRGDTRERGSQRLTRHLPRGRTTLPRSCRRDNRGRHLQEWRWR